MRGPPAATLSYTYQMNGVFAQLFEVLERAYDRAFYGDNWPARPVDPAGGVS
ncbi:hypothetical protein GCM10009712_37530 [Pseudarthrobacter sulfonivorans]